MDGAELYSHLAGHAGGHAYDGIVGLLDVHRPAIDDARPTRFVAWFERL